MSGERSGTTEGGLSRASVDPSLPAGDYTVLESGSRELEYPLSRPAGGPPAVLALGVPAAMVAVVTAFLVREGLEGASVLHWVLWTAGLVVMAEVFACAIWLIGPRSPLAAYSPRRLQKTARRHRSRYVTGQELELGDRLLLRRAQRAADSVMSSAVYEDGILNQAAAKAEIAQREWAIAVDLRKLSALRASRQKTVPGQPVSATTRQQLNEHLRQETAAEHGVRALVEALEARAAHVEHADTAYEDFLQHDSVTGLGDQLRELAASIAAHTEQSDTATDLEQQANAIFDALRELDEQRDHRFPPRPGKRSK